MKTVQSFSSIQIQPTIRQIGGKISLSSSNQCYVTNLQVRILVIKHQPAAEAWHWQGLCNNIERTIRDVEGKIKDQTIEYYSRHFFVTRSPRMVKENAILDLQPLAVLIVRRPHVIHPRKLWTLTTQFIDFAQIYQVIKLIMHTEKVLDHKLCNIYNP